MPASLALFLLSVTPASAFVESGCTSSREYIATLEFLRSQTALELAENDARKIALEVSQGCTGAGQRFIRVVQLLSKARMGATDAVAAGRELARKTDRETETFVTVFQYAFLEDYLDLDLASSLKMARSLSTEFDGDVLGVRDDFRTLVEFCSDADKVPMPRSSCGDFAVRMIKKGQAFSGGISRNFIDTYEFLRGGQGPKLPGDRALSIAEEVVAVGPGASENFIQGYRYAVGKKGLGLDIDAALAFARTLASQTVKAPARK